MNLYLPPEAVPARVHMGMTTMLTQTAMFASVRKYAFPTSLAEVFFRLEITNKAYLNDNSNSSFCSFLKQKEVRTCSDKATNQEFKGPYFKGS